MCLPRSTAPATKPTPQGPQSAAPATKSAPQGVNNTYPGLRFSGKWKARPRPFFGPGSLAHLCCRERLRRIPSFATQNPTGNAFASSAFKYSSCDCRRTNACGARRAPSLFESTKPRACVPEGQRACDRSCALRVDVGYSFQQGWYWRVLNLGWSNSPTSCNPKRRHLPLPRNLHFKVTKYCACHKVCIKVHKNTVSAPICTLQGQSAVSATKTALPGPQITASATM